MAHTCGRSERIAAHRTVLKSERYNLNDSDEQLDRRVNVLTCQESPCLRTSCSTRRWYNVVTVRSEMRFQLIDQDRSDGLSSPAIFDADYSGS